MTPNQIAVKKILLEKLSKKAEIVAFDYDSLISVLSDFSTTKNELLRSKALGIVSIPLFGVLINTKK